MGPGGEKVGQVTENSCSMSCILAVKRLKSTAELTDSSHSRTLIVNVFAADVTHHLGGHSLKGKI